MLFINILFVLQVVSSLSIWWMLSNADVSELDKQILDEMNVAVDDRAKIVKLGNTLAVTVLAIPLLFVAICAALKVLIKGEKE